MKEKKNYIYLIYGNNHIKIGRSHYPEKRLKDLQVGNPNKLSLVHKIPVSSKYQAMYVEKTLHRKFKKFQTQGEWFKGASIVRVVDACKKIIEKHDNYIEQPKREWIDTLKSRIGTNKLKAFLRKCKELGATQYALDKTFCKEISDAPICLYALKGKGFKDTGGRTLIGAICPQGPFYTDKNSSQFSSEGRDFLLLDL